MVKAEAVRNGGSIDTSNSVDGNMGDIVIEATAIVRALYESLDNRDKDASKLFLAIVGGMLTEWIEEYVQKDGGNYA